MSDSLALARQIGRHLAVGALQWRALPGLEESNPRSEIRIEAKLQGARFGVAQERPGGRWQVALLPAAAPAAHRRAYSAAVWLALTAKQATLYIEHLGRDSWWVIAVTPGVVDLRTDNVFAEDAAASQVDGLLQEYDQLDAGVEIFISGERELPSPMLNRHQRIRRPLEELLGTAAPSADARLEQLVGIRPSTFVALATVVLVAFLGYASYAHLQTIKERRELEMEQQRLIEARIAEERLATMTEVRIAQAVHAAVIEDTSKPRPSAVIRTCLDAASRIGSNYGGWNVTRMECDATATSLTLSLTQLVGAAQIRPTNADLLAKTKADRLQPAITIGASTASVTVPLSGVPPRPPLTLQQLPKQIAVIQELASRIQLTQAYGATGTAAEISPPSNRPVTYINPAMDDQVGDPQRIAQVPDERGFRVGGIALRGAQSWMLSEVFFDYPFLYINALSFVPTIQGYDFQLEASYVLAAD